MSSSPEAGAANDTQGTSRGSDDAPNDINEAPHDRGSPSKRKIETDSEPVLTKKPKLEEENAVNDAVPVSLT